MIYSWTKSSFIITFLRSFFTLRLFILVTKFTLKHFQDTYMLYIFIYFFPNLLELCATFPACLMPRCLATFTCSIEWTTTSEVATAHSASVKVEFRMHSTIKNMCIHRYYDTLFWSVMCGVHLQTVDLQLFTYLFYQIKTTSATNTTSPSQSKCSSFVPWMSTIHCKQSLTRAIGILPYLLVGGYAYNNQP